METKKNRQNFLVLVPHRDTRALLQKYSETLFKSGLCAYTFPLAAPLAALHCPLNADELKQIAHSLRKAAGESKFSAEGAVKTAFTTGAQEMDLYGPQLNIPGLSGILKESENKIKSVISPAALGVYLLPKDIEQQTCCQNTEYQKFDFRAAAIANMYWQPFEANGKTCFKWKIGKLCWLPKKQTNQPGA